MSLEIIKLLCIINICSGRENFVHYFRSKTMSLVNNEFILYIFDGLTYHQRALRELENHLGSFSIINVNTTRESYSL